MYLFTAKYGHYGNTYNNSTYNDFTYNVNTYNTWVTLLIMTLLITYFVYKTLPLTIKTYT